MVFCPHLFFSKALGSIPVNRGASQGVVEQMVEIFNTRNEFLLAIVPEGTRKKVPTIKTGFWHIARAAKVSIICWYLDNENKTARWLAEIIPGEDKIEDLIRIRDLYERVGYRFLWMLHCPLREIVRGVDHFPASSTRAHGLS